MLFEMLGNSFLGEKKWNQIWNLLRGQQEQEPYCTTVPLKIS